MTVRHSSSGYSQLLRSGPAMPAVDQHVDAAELRDHRQGCGFHLRFIDHVHDRRVHLARCAETLRLRFEPGAIGVPHRNRRAIGQQALGDRKSETARGASDDSDLVFEVEAVHQNLPNLR
jgi:hypothetical protein